MRARANRHRFEQTSLRGRFRLQLAPGAVVEPLPLLTLRTRRGIEVVAHAAR